MPILEAHHDHESHFSSPLAISGHEAGEIFSLPMHYYDEKIPPVIEASEDSG